MKNKALAVLTLTMILIIATSGILPLAFAVPIVGTNTNITNQAHGQNEPMIAINPLHNDYGPVMDLHVAVGCNDYREGTGRSIPGLYTSTDLTTWTFRSVSKPTYNSYGDPCLAYDSAGNLYYSYIAFNGDYGGTVYVSKSS